MSVPPLAGRLPVGSRVAALVRGYAPVRSRPVRTEDAATALVVAAWLALVVHDVVPPHAHSYLGSLLAWSLMAVAMMGVVVLPAVQYIARSSLRWRRGRAVAQFGVAYLVVWLLFGAIAVAVPTRLPTTSLPVLLALAALWQLGRSKRRALWACHRASPLPLRGRAATIGCLRFGWVHARACVGTCWLIMATMAFVPSWHTAWCAALTAVAVHERISDRPGRAAQQGAVVLGLAAVVAAAL